VAGYFFDSSAIVKRYVTERGSTWVRSLTIPSTGNDLYLARVTGVEVVAALVGHTPPLPPPLLAQALADFRHDYQTQYQLVEITPALIQEAMILAERCRLRGYDAVQLAAALQVHAVHLAMGVSSIVFISADVKLNAAATAEGLGVDDPNSHP
jgi:predicted nucleic acid-binding protein